MNQNLEKFWDKISIKKVDIDKEHNFLFNVYDAKKDGIIFWTTILVIPMISLFIFRFAFKMSDGGADWLPLVNQLFTIISASIGGFVLYKRNTRLFVKSGLFIFYLFLIIPFVLSMFGSMIVSIIPGATFEDDLGIIKISGIGQIFTTWFQIVGEIIVVLLAFKYTIDLKERFINTFKNNWKLLIIIGVIGAAIMFLISFGYNEAASAITGNENISNNQSSLESGLSKDNPLAARIGYAITLFILTVLVAPLAEELATRNAVFTGSGNRTVGLIVSLLYFGLIHMASGDVENILGYILGGVVLSFLFVLVKGNTTYVWVVHMLNNLIAMIILLVGNF
ncbi:CPBP family intramembrane glutamic endopeptidase [Mesoplasma photuris]|uniref:CPBP family intramembrane glutamic endopeptidase n=1 Tax=Mesoplasma photuris TaxID=217731 RepID=UPI0004E2265C|nr:CPBP family intramembrane glutamic endopeptidase [Mesoplasma photuris]